MRKTLLGVIICVLILSTNNNLSDDSIMDRRDNRSSAYESVTVKPTPGVAEKARVVPSRGVNTETAQQYEDTVSRNSKVLTMIATAYSEKGLTKSGAPAGPGVVAVDPRVIPLGTKLYIEGIGNAVALDTGRLIRGNRLDRWVSSRGEAIRWGKRKVNVHVYR